jgi:hypothetical protein
VTSTDLAAWISDGIGLAAILISLGVFLVEQRRANQERLRRFEEEDARRVTFVEACCKSMDAAVGAADWAHDTLASHTADDRLAISSVQPFVKGKIQPVREALTALRVAAPFDHRIILSLSRSIDILDRLGHDVGYWANAGAEAGPLVPRLAAYLRELDAEKIELRATVHEKPTRALRQA